MKGRKQKRQNQLTSSKQQEKTKQDQTKPKKSKQDQTKPKKSKQSESLLDSFSRELEGSKFRYINELLYTSRSDQAQQLFKDKPELFCEYHEGYAKQVEDWPVNPLDTIIDYIKKNKEITKICDMGCGEARLALECSDRHVESFDLHKINERVRVANIAKVPVQKGWADCVVFCLSLMGTDFHLFLKEAFRILKTNGLLIIAEPISRLKSIKAFSNGIQQLGFVELQQNANNVFVLYVFRKNATNFNLNGSQMEKLKKKIKLVPCLYKKR